ncbi:MAG: polysaccharide deacetylase family protein [Pseudomonadota bacterium]|nr:polysaccharide deacetylase family protein [Pseudomonadota bacterium]
MKALMYHYVRPAPVGLPYFRYLHVDDFCRQLDWLQARFPFPSWEEFREGGKTGAAPEGVVLTFDDGFRDHYEYVLPELKARNLWGFFFIPTAPLDSAVILDVHRVHLILGLIGGDKALQALRKITDASIIVVAYTDTFRDLTYTHQTNDDATALFKKTLNYYISYEYRAEVIARLFKDVYGDGPPTADEIYLSSNQIREMADAGMVIGSHGTNHLVFSRLLADEQRFEISDSTATLGGIIGNSIETFCYPYGGAGTFTDETQTILHDHGVLYSFAVLPEDINAKDFSERPHALPRYNCNQFPHGRASIGGSSPPAA